jgi:signal transduction histidine kinase
VIRTRPTGPDIATAVAVGVLALTEVAVNPALTPRGVAVAVELALAASVAWRRVAPLATAVLVALLMTAEALAGVPLAQPLVPLVTAVLAMYSAAAHLTRGWSVVALAVLVIADAVQVSVQDLGIGNFLFGLLFAGGTWVVGRLVRHRNRESAGLRQQALEAEAREAAQARSAADERRRIARDMHDVISHSVSVMVIQAGAAEAVLGTDPARAREALVAVQHTGRQALGELAHLLGVLRERGDEVGLEPQPGLVDVADLVGQAEGAGLRVRLSCEGSFDPLPPGIQLSGYRIVQEALTNVLKHARADCATVALRASDDGLEVEVTDDGEHPRGDGPVALPEPRIPSGGHGLVGLRERVAAYGGTLQSGPVESGGYRLLARLPAEVEP